MIFTVIFSNLTVFFTFSNLTFFDSTYFLGSKMFSRHIFNFTVFPLNFLKCNDIFPPFFNFYDFHCSSLDSNNSNVKFFKFNDFCRRFLNFNGFSPCFILNFNHFCSHILKSNRFFFAFSNSTFFFIDNSFILTSFLDFSLMLWIFFLTFSKLMILPTIFF